jgi:hypothetical protein
MNLVELVKYEPFPVELVQTHVDKMKSNNKSGHCGHSCSLCADPTAHRKFYCLPCSIAYQFAFALCQRCQFKNHHVLDFANR